MAADQTQDQTTAEDSVGRVAVNQPMVMRVQRRTIWSRTWYALRRWPIIPATILVVILFAAVFADWVAPTDPNFQKLPNFALYSPTWGQVRPESELMAELEATIDRSTPVGKVQFNQRSKDAFNRNEFILGSDGLGRDVLSRIIYGAQVSLKVTGYALLTGIVIGTSMGVLGGYYGGWLDEVLMRTVDVWNALPFLLVALIVALTLGATETTVIILIAMIAWPPFVRQVRADVLRIRSMDYVNAARIMGASNLRLMMRHVVPGTVSTILVVATLRVGGLILAESTLSFLGVGIPDPIPTWGKMVDEGYDFIINGVWWSSFFPGLAIFLLVMSLNFFGDWLRDRLDPRLRQLD